VLRSNHEWIKAIFSYRAAILAAKIQEVRAGRIGPVYIVGPISLRISVVVLEVKMVDQIVKSVFFKIGYINDGEARKIEVGLGNSRWFY